MAKEKRKRYIVTRSDRRRCKGFKYPALCVIRVGHVSNLSLEPPTCSRARGRDEKEILGIPG